MSTIEATHTVRYEVDSNTFGESFAEEGVHLLGALFHRPGASPSQQECDRKDRVDSPFDTYDHNFYTHTISQNLQD